MEAFLLTCDVFCVIVLLRNVLRVVKSGKEKDLGIFCYDDFKPDIKPLNNKNGAA